jgi:hypothetical protein
VAAKVITLVLVYVIPAASVTLPETVIAAEPAMVPVNPVQVMDFAPVLPAAIVTVPEDDASKNTSSADVGTDAPPAPPDVAAHLVPTVPSHEAVPPTQYLFAILRQLLGWQLLGWLRRKHGYPIGHAVLHHLLDVIFGQAMFNG